jgi:DNA-binding transcriptional LysR family regulator
VWVGLDGARVDPDQPVPLITYHAPSLSRATAVRALEGVGRTWRITCNTREVNGVLAAVRAGIGITVFAQSLIPPDLVQLPAQCGLPELGDVDIALVANPLAAREPVDALIAAIVGRPLDPVGATAAPV